jgi:hypothetical protein
MNAKVASAISTYLIAVHENASVKVPDRLDHPGTDLHPYGPLG